ncbi:MAG: AroM family protein [Thermotoga caldifontis]|uniref:AroM family protein n=1 Tax=Thermotoga caldifontis TaxID=1508419 RepID=UPI003C7B2666
MTIGETPRDDVIPELLNIVGNTNLAYNEIGLIENVEEEIYKPRDENDVLVSRKRDGSIVRISHRWIVQKLSQLECEGLCVFLCTGEFDSDRFILPYKVVDSFFSAMPKLNRATVIVPEKEQCSNALKRWAKIAKRVNCTSFSPYRESTLSVDLSQEQLVYLDCIGFALKHEEFFKRKTNGFVVSARRILANYLRNLLT